MKTVLVVAPHADDETLGCGGTLLKHFEQGDKIVWLIITSMSKESGFTDQQIKARDLEIQNVKALYGFHETHQLNFPPAMLDTIPLKEIVTEIKKIIDLAQPEIVYTVNRDDVHSDHVVVADAVITATKCFRTPSIKRLLAFETLSETEFSLRASHQRFQPNVFIDIEDYLEKKILIMNCYESEVSNFPFPRSNEAIEAIAKFRGVQAGCCAAEAFMLLKELN